MSGSHRLDAITLGDDALEVELWRDPAYTSGSADSVHRYGREVAGRPPADVANAQDPSEG